MTNTTERYRTALDAFCTPGGRWSNNGSLTYWGRASGLTADEIIEDVHANGVNNRDADIRRGFESARRFDNHSTCRAKRSINERSVNRRSVSLVRTAIEEIGHGEVGIDGVRELSPCLDWIGNSPEVQTSLFFRCAFKPDDKVFVFRSNSGTKGIPGQNIKRADEWTKDIVDVGETGDLVKTNPFCGEAGNNKEGKTSYVSQDCICDYPYALVEFDDMPTETQYKFWRWFLLADKHSSSLASLVHSGGKSIHGLIYVGARTLEDWQLCRDALKEMYSSDEDPKMRCDIQALHPLIGTRIPGVMRRGNNKIQELVYLNPKARGLYQAEQYNFQYDFSKPPCKDAHGKGYCGVCEAMVKCPFSEKDIRKGTTEK